jgi:hypothetical protein
MATARNLQLPFNFMMMIIYLDILLVHEHFKFMWRRIRNFKIVFDGMKVM